MVTRPVIYTAEFVLKELEGMYKTLIKDDHIIFINQLIIPKPYSRQRYSEWAEKFKDDDKISDAIKRIEDVLEARVVVGALEKDYDKTMTIFLLKNKYGWEDKVKQEVDQKSEIVVTKIAIEDPTNGNKV